MVNFLEVYAEAGMIGVVGAMFVYMVYNLNRRANSQDESLDKIEIEMEQQSTLITNIQNMLIKLIDRWNKSDETRDRRHEDLLKEINDVNNDVKEMKGAISRINGRK
jgi:hypothetical protein